MAGGGRTHEQVLKAFQERTAGALLEMAMESSMSIEDAAACCAAGTEMRSMKAIWQHQQRSEISGMGGSELGVFGEEWLLLLQLVVANRDIAQQSWSREEARSFAKATFPAWFESTAPQPALVETETEVEGSASEDEHVAGRTHGELSQCLHDTLKDYAGLTSTGIRIGFVPKPSQELNTQAAAQVTARDEEEIVQQQGATIDRPRRAGAKARRPSQRIRDQAEASKIVAMFYNKGRKRRAPTCRSPSM